jgi:hypothetical protein
MTDLRQLHYRFRTDAGAADASPTWGAGEDVTYYPGAANFRLRIGLRNASTVVAATPWELYVSRNGDAYTPVTTTIAKGVQSIDAGASADDTAVLIPRLYPFTQDWILSGAAIDLDFAGSRIYGAAAFTDVLSISRASTGYAKTGGGLLTSFATNTLRITDLGLLVEGARENLVVFSQSFATSAVWSPQNTTITDNVTAAPDGTTTASSIIADTSNNVHRPQQNCGAASSTAKYAYSCYLKANGYQYGLLVASRSGVSDYQLLIDLTGGTILDAQATFGSPTGVSSGIEVLANGWIRAWIVQDVTSGDTIVHRVGVYNAATYTSGAWTGDGVNGIYAWGAQVEAGTFPSSYVPTTGGSTATRAADSITITGAAQTIIAAAIASIIAQTGNAAGTGFAANIVDSNGTNVLGFDATNHALASLVATLATSNTANRSTTDDKLGLAWDGTGRSLVLNGATVVTDASAQTPSSTQRLGSANGTSNFIYSYVERLTLWNSKLADATLDALTAP